MIVSVRYHYDKADLRDFLNDKEKIDCIAQEIVDVTIYVLHYAHLFHFKVGSMMFSEAVDRDIYTAPLESVSTIVLPPDGTCCVYILLSMIDYQSTSYIVHTSMFLDTQMDIHNNLIERLYTITPESLAIDRIC